MIPFDPVHIHFHIPATDPLGKEEVLGKLRFLAEHIEIDWQLKGSLFTGGKGELQTITVPYTEVEHVELVKRWFKIRRLVFRIATPALVKDIPGVELIEPEGTFLLWMDFRELGFQPDQLTAFLKQKAHWAVTRGHAFGEEGAGFARVNIGCTRADLEAALTNLGAAVG